MPDIPKEYEWEWVHNKGLKACFNIAYYAKRKLEPGDKVESNNFIYSDGTFPAVGEIARCGYCRKEAYPGKETDQRPRNAQT